MVRQAGPGRVHPRRDGGCVSTGHSGFPTALADCHARRFHGIEARAACPWPRTSPRKRPDRTHVRAQHHFAPNVSAMCEPAANVSCSSTGETMIRLPARLAVCALAAMVVLPALAFAKPGGGTTRCPSRVIGARSASLRTQRRCLDLGLGLRIEPGNRRRGRTGAEARLPGGHALGSRLLEARLGRGRRATSTGTRNSRWRAASLAARSRR